MEHARYVLGNSPIRDKVTTLECTGATTQQILDYLLYVVPRFPNIAEVYGLTQDHVDVLLGDAIRLGSESDEVGRAKLQEARKQFEELARRIDEWSLFPKTEYLLKIASLGRDAIRSFHLFPNTLGLDQANFPHDLRDSQFHKVISLLPNLGYLSVLGLASLSSNDLDPFHPDALTEIYPFADSLFSLGITLCGSHHPKFTNFLEFCGRFPNLGRLSIDVVFRNDKMRHFNATPFSLPQLTRLFLESNSIHAFLTILPIIHAPNVQTLTLSASEATCLAQGSPSSMASLGKIIVEQYPTLRELRIDTQDRVGLSGTLIDTLRASLSPVGISLRLDSVYGSFESSLKKKWKYPFKLVSDGAETILSNDPDESDEEEEEEEEEEEDQRLTEFEPSSTHDETLAAVTKGASELGSWIKHQAESCRVTGDVEGGKKLMRLLEPAGEWKLHLED